MPVRVNRCLFHLLVLLSLSGIFLSSGSRAQDRDRDRQSGRSIVNLAMLEGREKTGDGLWVASTGHSCVAPAIRPITMLARVAGRTNHTHLFQFGGGMSGAARMQWEREGEKQEIKPALETGKFDLLTFGHFLKGADAEDYERWMALALEHNPEIRFYIQDLWPWTSDLFEKGTETVTMERYEAAMKHFGDDLASQVAILNKKFDDRVRVIPVGPAMVEMVKRFQAGKLPGVDGLVVSPDQQPGVGLYRDHIHPGAVVSWLEGYVWYACLYGKNPAGLDASAGYHKEDPALDRILREVAWEIVTTHPLSGVSGREPE